MQQLLFFFRRGRLGSSLRDFRRVGPGLLVRPCFRRSSEGLVDTRANLVYSLVDSVVDPFLRVLGRSKVPPKDCLYSYYLSVNSERVLYSPSVLAYGYVVRVL